MKIEQFKETLNITPQALNKDLEIIKEKLVDYLKIQEEKITNEIINEQIKAKIFAPFDVRDISYNILFTDIEPVPDLFLLPDQILF